MKTVNQKLRKVIPWATSGFTVITIISCSSYQGVLDEEDGIYGNINTVEVSNPNDSKNNYYQQYFSTKAAQIEEISEEDLIFTDIDAYSTTESMDEEGYVVVEEEYIDDYGPWGNNTDDITINVYGGWNNGFYGNGWNLGYWYGGWNAGYWGGFRPWGFNYWNNPFWGFGNYWGYNPYWGWNNAFNNPWFYFNNGWAFGNFYNPWHHHSGNYSAISNRGRSNQNRQFSNVSRNTVSKDNGEFRRQSNVNQKRGRGISYYRGGKKMRYDRQYTRKSKPVASNSARPMNQNNAPSNTAKNFKLKRRSHPSHSGSNLKPDNSNTQKPYKAQNANQRSFNRPNFRNSRPMSSPRNFSRPSSGRGSIGRGGRG